MDALITGVELYTLLETSPTASSQDLRKAAHTRFLALHPDKQRFTISNGSRTVHDNLFTKVHAAYTFLKDEGNRRLYDSSFPMDDGERSSSQDFFISSGWLFEKLGRYSKRQPVPNFGGRTTTLEDVDRFYKFWESFQSWRNPVVVAQSHGEHLYDLDTAETETQRQFMAEYNMEIAKPYEQWEQENVDIRGFPALASRIADKASRCHAGIDIIARRKLMAFLTTLAAFCGVKSHSQLSRFRWTTMKDANMLLSI